MLRADYFVQFRGRALYTTLCIAGAGDDQATFSLPQRLIHFGVPRASPSSR